MEIKKEDPEAIRIPERLRAFNPEKVKQLAESMAAIGLQHPVTVWSPVDGDLELVAGRHRVQAAIDLGWNRIDTIDAKGMTDIDRQLWEIDENLMRAELAPAEHADHLTRREKLWEARKNLGGKSFPTKGDENTVQTLDSIKGPGRPKGFAADTAEKTGTSKSAVHVALSRGKNIPADILALIKGTKLDKGVYLDSLKGLEPDKQKEIVLEDLADLEKPKPTKPKKPKAPVNKDDERLATAKRLQTELWAVLRGGSAEMRSRFYAWENEQESEG